MADSQRTNKPMNEQRLAALLSAYREPQIDPTRLAALGDRLEHALRKAAPRRAWWRHPMIVAAAAAVIVIAPLGTWWAVRAVPIPTATLIAALPVIRQGANPAARPLTLVNEVAAGQPIRIDGGTADLSWADGTTLTLDDGTAFSLTDAGDGAKRIAFTHGRLAANVAPQPRRHPLRIATPQADLTVVGTAFTVETDPGGTRIAVTHGSVAMHRPADAADVAPALISSGEVAIASASALPISRPAALLPVRNPGFELPLVADSRFGWHADEQRNHASAHLVSNTFSQGRQSLLLAQDQPLSWPPELAEHPDFQVFLDTPIGGGGGHVSVSQDFPVQAERTYTLAFSWRSQGLSRENRTIGPDRGLVKFAACLFWLRADGERCVPGREVLSTGDDEPAWTSWPAQSQAERGVIQAPADAVTAAISFKLTTIVAGRTPQVWVDDVSFSAQ